MAGVCPARASEVACPVDARGLDSGAGAEDAVTPPPLFARLPHALLLCVLRHLSVHDLCRLSRSCSECHLLVAAFAADRLSKLSRFWYPIGADRLPHLTQLHKRTCALIFMAPAAGHRRGDSAAASALALADAICTRVDGLWREREPISSGNQTCFLVDERDRLRVEVTAHGSATPICLGPWMTVRVMADRMSAKQLQQLPHALCASGVGIWRPFPLHSPPDAAHLEECSDCEFGVPCLSCEDDAIVGDWPAYQSVQAWHRSDDDDANEDDDDEDSQGDEDGEDLENVGTCDHSDANVDEMDVDVEANRFAAWSARRSNASSSRAREAPWLAVRTSGHGSEWQEGNRLQTELRLQSEQGELGYARLDYSTPDGISGPVITALSASSSAAIAMLADGIWTFVLDHFGKVHMQVRARKLPLRALRCLNASGWRNKNDLEWTRYVYSSDSAFDSASDAGSDSSDREEEEGDSDDEIESDELVSSDGSDDEGADASTGALHSSLSHPHGEHLV